MRFHIRKWAALAMTSTLLLSAATQAAPLKANRVVLNVMGGKASSAEFIEVRLIDQGWTSRSLCRTRLTAVWNQNRTLNHIGGAIGKVPVTYDRTQNKYWGQYGEMIDVTEIVKAILQTSNALYPQGRAEFQSDYDVALVSARDGLEQRLSPRAVRLWRTLCEL